MFCPECGNHAANKALRKLGVKDESKVFTYDGNPEGKETFAPTGGEKAIRVGDVIDPTSVTKIVGVLSGQEMEILADDTEIVQPIDGLIAFQYGGTAFVFVITVDGVLGASAGTYAAQNDNYYVSRIETETIHPIDQKYLPGVCLPVVELSAETLTALYSGKQVMATEKETAAFMAAKEKVTPLVVRGNFNGAGFASVAWFSTDSTSGTQAFGAPIGVLTIIASFVDGGVMLFIGN